VAFLLDNLTENCQLLTLSVLLPSAQTNRPRADFEKIAKFDTIDFDPNGRRTNKDGSRRNQKENTFRLGLTPD